MTWNIITSALGISSAGNILNWSIELGSVVALGVIVYGGILYTASAGNESRKSEAKEWMKAAVYGMILLFSAYLILNTINPALVGH